MCTEQEIRLRLNDLHLVITDVLEQIDEHAYIDANLKLNHMCSDIEHLRKEVSTLLLQDSLLAVWPSTPRRATA